MNSLLILILSLTFSFQSNANTCNDQQTERQNRNLTFIGRIIDPFIPNGILKPEERAVLANNPQALLAVRNSACRAWALSFALCGISKAEIERGQALEEETDALRHFIFSALIACAQGTRFATNYTTAHEGHPEAWGETEQMDLHNNRIGIEWANPLHRRCDRYSDENLLRGAIQALRAGQLETIERGHTLCANRVTLQRANLAQVVQTSLQFEREHLLGDFCRSTPSSPNNSAPEDQEE